MRLTLRHIGLFFLFFLLGGINARAGSCDPKFGDEIFRWVDRTVPQQSRSLSSSDYHARTFNYFLLAFDDLNRRMGVLQADIDAISDTIARDEATDDRDQIKVAVDRDASATSLLNQLFAARFKVDVVRRRLNEINTTPNEANFDVDGLGNVGRATLLSSLLELGSSAQKSLSARFSVYVSVTMDEEGNAKDSSVQHNGDMVDAVLSALANTGNPYAIAVAVLVKVGRMAYEQKECEDRVNAQRQIMYSAFKLLPDRLIGHAEQLALYQGAYASQVAKFAAISNKIKALTDQSEKRWKELFTYNAARQATANTVLTPAKVSLIEKEYQTSGDLHDIFSNIAISRFATKIQEMNSYLAEQQVKLLSVCGEVAGIQLVEDQQDALAFGLASLGAFTGKTQFIPLKRLIDRSTRLGHSELDEANEIRSHIALQPCSKEGKKSLRRTPAEFLDSDHTKATTQLLSRAPFAASGGTMTCVLVRSGNHYDCGQPGGGLSYGSQFGSDTGDPREDVLRGANDGGYAHDNLRIGEDIAAVTANIDKRIEDLNQRVAEAEGALPEWTQKNGAALDEQLDRNEANTTADATAALEFATQNQALLADAKAKLDDFLKGPADETRINELLESVDATDLSLPNIQTSRIPVDIPLLPGVTAADRIYASGSTVDERLLARETLKVAETQFVRQDEKQLAQTALSLAGQFQNAGAAPELTRALIGDAAAVRYFASGEMSHLEMTFIDEDGRQYRAPVTDLNRLPPETLISQAQRFNDANLTFTARARTLQDIIGAGGGTKLQERSLSFADMLAQKASLTFYSGETVTGLEIMRLATVALDITTSLTPGISWGRDIYESITGRNLITGEELTPFERTVAIVGAISAGVAGEGPKILRALDKVANLGKEAKDAEHIVEAAARIDSGAVKWTEHAEEALDAEDMFKQGIGKDEVEDALDRGTKFFDTEEGTIVSYEIEVVGRDRAAAAVNPDTMDLKTVFPEGRTDATLSQVESKTKPGDYRFKLINHD